MNDSTTDFTTTLVVDQSPAETFRAVQDVRGWWSQSIEGSTAALDDEFVFEVKDVHYCRIRLSEVVPDRRIVWLVTYSYIAFVKDKDEWTGSQVIFDIAENDGKTKLTFTHKGLAPQAECYDACAPAWTAYMQHSLHQLITTGHGDPNLEGTMIEQPAEAGSRR